MIIGFTGTRSGMSSSQLETLRWTLRALINTYKVKGAIHGGCVGSDEQFHGMCHDMRMPIAVYFGHPKGNPSDVSMVGELWGGYKNMGRHPYLDRNRKIVDNSNIILAAPLNYSKVGGTWYTIDYARNGDKKDVIIFSP